RDQGALRVLFFAPVDPVGLLGGHLLAGLATYTLLLLLTVPLLALLALWVNLPFPPTLLIGMIVSPLLIAPAIAAGLFISAIAPSSRSAMFLFVAALASLLAIQIGYSVLLSMPSTSRYYDALLFLRELVGVLRNAAGWVSPLSLLSDGLDAAIRESWWQVLFRTLSGLAGATGWLALAAWALRRRGVLP
ncbi:MAG: hypothetical protein ACRDJ9_35535, partial [Dehalococcoidia bacterium]